MTTNNNIREIEEPKDADNTSVYEPRIPSDWSLEQILINYRTSAADLAQRAERGELVTTEEIKKVDDRTYQAITALQNKAVLSELENIYDKRSLALNGRSVSVFIVKANDIKERIIRLRAELEKSK